MCRLMPLPSSTGLLSWHSLHMVKDDVRYYGYTAQIDHKLTHLGLFA